MTTTCQICGRAIKTRRDVIAQHGYRQPWLRSGDGSRTTPCDGSGHRPYEVSRDAIPPAMAARVAARTLAEAAQAQLLADPPATLEHRWRDAFRGTSGTVTLDRPAGFDPVATVNRGSYRSPSYDHAFSTRVRELEQRIAGLAADHEFLQGRFDAWVAPSEVAA